MMIYWVVLVVAIVSAFVLLAIAWRRFARFYEFNNNTAAVPAVALAGASVSLVWFAFLLAIDDGGRPFTTININLLLSLASMVLALLSRKVRVPLVPCSILIFLLWLYLAAVKSAV